MLGQLLGATAEYPWPVWVFFFLAEVLRWLQSPCPDLHSSLRNFSSYRGTLSRNDYWTPGLLEAVSHCLAPFPAVSQSKSKRGDGAATCRQAPG